MKKQLAKHLAKHLVLALIAATCWTAVHAQTWPTKPVKIVVPSAAGSAPDILTRLLGIELQKRLGQPVVPENKPGAGGSLGADPTYQDNRTMATFMAADAAKLEGRSGLRQHHTRLTT